MKVFFSDRKTFVSFYLLFLISALFLLSSSKPTFTADSSSKELRITVLYPSLGVVKELVELREQQLMPQEKIVVTGVYHEDEWTEYEKSVRFVDRKKLRWFKFHKLSADIQRGTLFKKNSLSDEFKKIFNKSDGIIFFGGGDIPPFLYNNKTNLLTQTSTPYRHFLELSFLFHLLGGSQDEDFKPLIKADLRIPILCICLGLQSLNVAAGGTLIQDIPSEVYGIDSWDEYLSFEEANWHRNPFAYLYPELVIGQNLYPFILHPIKILDKTKFTSDLGFNTKDTPYVISGHHQMADKLGKGLKVAATSIDGKVVEALEHQDYPNVLGIQFHPDFIELWDQTKKFRLKPDQEEQSLLSILEKNSPSLDFNKKIWTWFFKKAKAYHRR